MAERKPSKKEAQAAESSKTPDQARAEERAAALGNTPVADRPTDETQHVYEFPKGHHGEREDDDSGENKSQEFPGHATSEQKHSEGGPGEGPDGTSGGEGGERKPE